MLFSVLYRIFIAIRNRCHSYVTQPFLHEYTRQQTKRIVLLFCFASLIVIIVYSLLSNQICLCMATGFAAFSFHNATNRKEYAIFLSKKTKVTKSLLTVSRTQFKCNFAARECSVINKRYKTLENLTLMQFCRTCKHLPFPSKFVKVF